MAYAAAVSLQHTIKPLGKCFTVGNNAVKLLYDDVSSLQNVLTKLNSSRINRKRVHSLDEQIREALCELEDAISTHPLSTDLQKLKPHFDSFTHKVNKLQAAYIHELEEEEVEEEEQVEEEGDLDYHDNTIDFDGNNGRKMVGLSDQFIEIKQVLIKHPYRDSGNLFLSLEGMAGIGKTALAKALVRDPLITSLFERRAFVTLGPNYRLQRVILDILKQLNPDEYVLMEGGEELDALKTMMHACLIVRKYLIVLDDVWDVDLTKQLAYLFPEPVDGCAVLVTTRLYKVAEVGGLGCQFVMRFLDKNESWELLRRKVFDEMSCPSELDKSGKKIAENCEGLPLTIINVAEILSESEKTAEYWNEVAATKQHSVYVDAYDRMYKVLYPSYDHLDQDLKPCFLYMGVFPQNHEIPCSKLFDLWIVEGFLKPVWFESPAFFARCRFFKLSDSNVAMVHKESLGNVNKTCGLHSSFWHLCNKVAEKNKFFHGVKSLGDGLAEEDLKGQRRLCIRNNVLFGIKDAYNSMGSITTVRSLLCTGPYHQYPVPVCLEYLTMLRILYVLTILFYEFPTEALNLVQLAYLALTFNGNIPASISKLRNLHYLIVHRNLSIIESDGNSSSYLPMEIWDMEKLKHLDVMGSDLPNPKREEEDLLPKLVKLLGVGPRSCTKDVLGNMPALQKLGVQIELAPDNNNNDDEPLCFFDHISHLKNLEKLKCIIANPKIASGKIFAPPAASLSFLPSSLEKLTLSGFGYPWEEISKISSSLPNLKVLKLKCYAFRGPKWVVGEKEFPSLQYLRIEDADLEQWTVGDRGFINKLRKLSIKHCYRLEEIPSGVDKCLQNVEVVDCSRAAVTWAKKLKADWDRKHFYRYPKLVLDVESSWDDGSIKS